MDEQPKKKSLSEISHLFLSSVRDNATGGTRPTRLPPGSARPMTPPLPDPKVSIDLTPEEYARVYGTASLPADTTDAEKPPVGPMSAVICSQFNGRQFDRVKEYARHLASGGDRVGLIEIDAAECRVICFEANSTESLETAEPATLTDSRQMAEALEELAWDIDRWLLLLPSPRTPEARSILRHVNHWVLLSTCDHDGVVSGYRAIKGLVDSHRPRLTLALLNAVDQVETAKVYRKIAGVCEQFLNWKMDAEPAVESVDGIAEHLAMVHRPTRDRGAVGPAAHWQVVADFLARANEQNQTSDEEMSSTETVDSSAAHDFQSAERITMSEPTASTTRIGDFVLPAAATARPAPAAAVAATVTEPAPRPLMEAMPAPAPMPTPAAMPAPSLSIDTADADGDITDLPEGDLTEATILQALVRKPSAGLVECPIKPPACPAAMLTVARDRRLVLLAVTRKGLLDLRAIATAYRWVIENRPLLSMALPQFSIDTHALPGLRLLVDRADAQADLLLPMTENKNVTVQTYRKLRWAGKTGLLLEAA